MSPSVSTKMQTHDEHSKISDNNAVTFHTSGQISNIQISGVVDAQFGVTISGETATRANWLIMDSSNITDVCHSGTGSLLFRPKFEGERNLSSTVRAQIKKKE